MVRTPAQNTNYGWPSDREALRQVEEFNGSLSRTPRPGPDLRSAHAAHGRNVGRALPGTRARDLRKTDRCNGVPGFARMAQLQGIVILEARISPQGTAENISVVSGKWPLANPAKETLSKWRFAGCTSTGRRCTTKFIFSFVLSGTCTPGSDCPTEFEVDLPNKVLVKCEVFDSLISATERPMPTTS